MERIFKFERENPFKCANTSLSWGFFFGFQNTDLVVLFRQNIKIYYKISLKMKFESQLIIDVIFNQVVPLISCRSTYKINANGVPVLQDILNLFFLEIFRFKIIHENVQVQTAILGSSHTVYHFAHRQFRKL